MLCTEYNIKRPVCPGLERHFETSYTPVFFNLYAAAEPSANVCVAHGTLCNCITVALLQPYRSVIANFVPGNFGVFWRNPWQPLAEA